MRVTERTNATRQPCRERRWCNACDLLARPRGHRVFCRCRPRLLRVRCNGRQHHAQAEDACSDSVLNSDLPQPWSYFIMADVTVYGFPISTFVNIVRLVLTHKEVAFDFHDLEPKMGSPSHLALHPFNRVPILDHAGFRIYE